MTELHFNDLFNFFLKEIANGSLRKATRMDKPNMWAQE